MVTKDLPINPRFIPACAGNGRDKRARATARSVHPRVCGERRLGTHFQRQTHGSSPRVRGTALTPDLRGVERRFIPACAGNGAGPARVFPPVHPRVERRRAVLSTPTGTGSSPRAGTADVPIHVVDHQRFIPACGKPMAVRSRLCSGIGSSSRVGNGFVSPPPVCRVHHLACAGTENIWFETYVVPVHPRVRTGTLHRWHIDTPVFSRVRTYLSDYRQGRPGSSPRVRGTVNHLTHGRACERFIPACAGNGLRFPIPDDADAVHPRVCGERTSDFIMVCPPLGSSPRVRGTDGRHGSGHVRGRFIPACAGNGALGPQALGRGPVHPRVCGERKTYFSDQSSKVGSSPRVRGTVHTRSQWPEHIRFIPACAGNGSSPHSSLSDPPVHPRVCGERPVT